jgi:acetyl-CoA acetyltransferase
VRADPRSGPAAIAGAWETADRAVIPDVALADLHVIAAQRALAVSGLRPRDVDGVASPTAAPGALAGQLGISPRWVEGTSSLSGCGTLVQLRRAAAALAAGLAETVVVVHAESVRSRLGWAWPTTDPSSHIGQFEAPFGPGPQSRFAMYLTRYMAVHDVTESDLAAVPVAQRRWAQGNPGAAYREPITEDDVLASPVIAWPLRRLECAATTDNAGAFVVTSAARAADLVPCPVGLLGGGEGYDSELVSDESQPLAPRPLGEAVDAAMRGAGLQAADLDHLMLYDGFAHAVLFGLDALAVCPQGGGGKLVRQENEPGGRWPINTNGGYLSYRHGDMAQLQEAVRQLRGEACAQVPGVGTSLVLGVGPAFSSACAVILARVRPAGSHRVGLPGAATED